MLVVQYELHYIRLFSECLKNLNQIFFLRKHIDKNGTVQIKTITKELGYNMNDSKKKYSNYFFMILEMHYPICNTNLNMILKIFLNLLFG